MTKHILTSLFLHSLVLLISVSAVKRQELVMQEKQGKGSGGDADKGNARQTVNFEIINLTDSPGKVKELKRYYWGIGISSNLDLSGYLVTEVATGYSAETAGLRPGDYIIAINGEPVTDENDLRGDGPKKLVLTILRNSARVIITLERCKVYY